MLDACCAALGCSGRGARGGGGGIPPIRDAILCTWIMHAVSKILISQSPLVFHARARGRREAQLEPPAGKTNAPPKRDLGASRWCVSRSLAACDWRARLNFLAKDLMEHGFRVSDVPR